MANRTNGIWLFLRNLFAFIGGGIAIVGGGIGIWQSISAAKSEVVATIELNRFTLPGPVSKTLANENARFFAEIINKAKSAPLPTPPKPGEPEKPQGNFAFSAYDREQISRPPVASLDTYVRMSVVNQGDAPAKSLSIKMPEEFFYVVVEREDGARSEVPHRKRIELDALAPKQGVKVHGWSAASVDSINVNQLVDNTVVSYDLGMAAVRAEATPVMREYENQRWWTRIAIPVGLGAILGLIGLAFFEYNRRGIRNLAKDATREELEAFAKAFKEELEKDDRPF